MKNYLILLLVFTCIVFIGCSERSSQKIQEVNILEYTFGDTINIKMGQKVFIQDKNIYITFKNVTIDSRCPVNINCVWGGEAKANFVIEYSNGEEINKELSFLSSHQEILYFSIGNMFKLGYGSLEPYPKAFINLKKAKYSLDFVLRENTYDPYGMD